MPTSAIGCGACNEKVKLFIFLKIEGNGIDQICIGVKKDRKSKSWYSDPMLSMSSSKLPVRRVTSRGYIEF
jgi:hypothetical protein